MNIQDLEQAEKAAWKEYNDQKKHFEELLEPFHLKWMSSMVALNEAQVRDKIMKEMQNESVSNS